jgi:hypothetical protein
MAKPWPPGLHPIALDVDFFPRPPRPLDGVMQHQSKNASAPRLSVFEPRMNNLSHSPPSSPAPPRISYLPHLPGSFVRSIAGTSRLEFPATISHPTSPIMPRLHTPPNWFLVHRQLLSPNRQYFPNVVGEQSVSHFSPSSRFVPRRSNSI